MLAGNALLREGGDREGGRELRKRRRGSEVDVDRAQEALQNRCVFENESAQESKMHQL